MKRTSTSYVTTLDVNSSTDMEMLRTIKKAVSVMNYRNPNKKRVVLRGRKPIVAYSYYWAGKTFTHSYDLSGNIVGGLANATKLDVYIYDRRD
jgi:hypothetical protein